MVDISELQLDKQNYPAVFKVRSVLACRLTSDSWVKC